VAITRCTHEIALYTDNVEDLQEKVKREQYKFSTVDVDFEGISSITENKNTEHRRKFDIGKIYLEFVEQVKTLEIMEKKTKTIEKE
jgi:hypothetical protein